MYSRELLVMDGVTETCRVSFQNKINLRHWCIWLVLPWPSWWTEWPWPSLAVLRLVCAIPMLSLFWGFDTEWSFVVLGALSRNMLSPSSRSNHVMDYTGLFTTDSQSVLFDLQTHSEIVESLCGSLKLLPFCHFRNIFTDEQTDLPCDLGSVLSFIQKWSGLLRLHNH